uniref:Lactosylceramide 4-alpha-galactosyltransferase n=1 Tax=Leptobrachium leishanense TaxID=445787 RepID=A0A8C5MQ67_9ANUR
MLEMKPRWRTLLLFLFGAVVLVLMVSYTVYTPVSEAVTHIRPYPHSIKCPQSLSSMGNASGRIMHDGGIFFMETSEQTNPSFQVMCAVESAAITHPNTKVTVLMKGLSNRTHPSLGLSFLSCFPNVEFAPMNLREVFADTPLSGWYTSVEENREFCDLPILADACRLAVLWRSGGVYLDTDFIIFKNLENVTNALGKQSPYTLNGAILSFHTHHPFIERCMEDFVNRYNYWFYGHQGPQLFTRVFKRWCSIQRLRDSDGCKGVNILPKKAFYPVDWQEWRKFFRTISQWELEELLRNSYGIHLWNKKTQGARPIDGSFLDQLQTRFCPETHKLMKMHL